MQPREPAPGTVKAQVLALARAGLGNNAIAREIKRSPNHVSVELSALRRARLLPPADGSHMACVDEAGSQTVKPRSASDLLPPAIAVAEERDVAVALPIVVSSLLALLGRVDAKQAALLEVRGEILRAKVGIQAAADRLLDLACSVSRVPAGGQSRLSQPLSVPATEREVRAWAERHGMFFSHEVSMARVNTKRCWIGLPPFEIIPEAQAAE